MKKKLLSLLLSMFFLLVLQISVLPAFSQKYASDPPFKVKIDFNRWHDVHELWDDMKRLEKAFPKFLKTISLGKSFDGLDILGMIINNPDTGPEMSKAAMYIDGNIHGNEIQAGEVSVYTIWYLMENYGKIDKITQIVDERVFYVFPCVNPDGRQYFMKRKEGAPVRAMFPLMTTMTAFMMKIHLMI